MAGGSRGRRTMVFLGVAAIHGWLAYALWSHRTDLPPADVESIDIAALPLQQVTHARARPPTEVPRTVTQPRMSTLPVPEISTPVIDLPVTPEALPETVAEPVANPASAATKDSPQTTPSNGVKPQSWPGQLLAWVRVHKIYPGAARNRRLEGTVSLEFLVERNGLVKEVRIVRGSGYDLLDAAALQLFEGQTVPSFPDSMRQQEMWVQLALRYTVSGL